MDRVYLSVSFPDLSIKEAEEIVASIMASKPSTSSVNIYYDGSIRDNDDMNGENNG